VPHLTPEPGYVIGDHALRAPALVFADSKIALALIPDIADVEAPDGAACACGSTMTTRRKP
jgi:hypothetical protein